MFLRHFNLREQPFGVTPDPRFLFASGTHREALAALIYGLESSLGFVALTANPGMGKTTLLFEVLRRMNETAKTVFLFQTIASPADLFRALLIDLGVENPQGTLVDHQTQLNQILVKQSATGKRLIIFLDEAQNLSDSVLEAVRMLSNFETGHKKLMQIVLSGQLQFAERLAEHQLMQLRQRISIFAYLKPLSVLETAEYIQHRMKTAGWDSKHPIFTAAAMAMIAEQSQGIPRNINNLCFNSLTLACAMQKASVDLDAVREVVADLDIRSVIAPVGAPALLPPSGAKPLPAPAVASNAKIQSEPIAAMEVAAPVFAIDAEIEPQPIATMEAAAPVIAIDMKIQPEPIATMETATPVLAIDARIQPDPIPAMEPAAPLEPMIAREAKTAPAQVIQIDAGTPYDSAIALEARALRERLTVIEANTRSGPVAATDANHQQPPATVKGRPRMGLAHALSGSAAELCAEWS